MYNSNPFFISVFILLFFLLILEKKATIFFRERENKKFLLNESLTSIPTLLYLLISSGGVLEIFIAPKILNLRVSFIGVILLAAGFILRRDAIKTLGNNWSIYVSSKFAQKIISKGPYRYNRHPYYWASMFELAGFLAIPNSYISLSLAITIQAPLYILRIIFEEKELIKKFGLKYVAYQRKSFNFFPGENFIALGIVSLKTNLQQLFNLINLLGIKHLLKIIKVHGHMLLYARNSMISQCFSALMNVGFLDEIRIKGSVNIDAFCRNGNFSRKYLKGICEYLYAVRIFEKFGVNTFSLSKKGDDLYKSSHGVFNLLHAYAPLFFDLELLLTNKKIYGK